MFPYLLRTLTIARPNHVWAADITYIPMARSFVYLVAIMDWAARKFLAWRISLTLASDFCVAALEEAIRRFGAPEILSTRPRVAIQEHRVSQRPARPSDPDQHRRPRPLAGQRIHRTTLALGEIGRGLPPRLRDRLRRPGERYPLLHLLQPSASARGTGSLHPRRGYFRARPTTATAPRALPLIPAA